MVEAIDETPGHHYSGAAVAAAESVRPARLDFDVGRQAVTAAVTVRWAWA